MGASAPSAEELAATAPGIALKGHLMPIVLAIEVYAEAADVHPASLLGVALGLLYLTDEA